MRNYSTGGEDAIESLGVCTLLDPRRRILSKDRVLVRIVGLWDDGFDFILVSTLPYLLHYLLASRRRVPTVARIIGDFSQAELLSSVVLSTDYNADDRVRGAVGADQAASVCGTDNL